MDETKDTRAGIAKVIAIDGGKSSSVAEAQANFASMVDDIKNEKLRGFVISAVLEDGSVLTAMSPGTANMFSLLGAVEWSKHRVQQRIEEP